VRRKLRAFGKGKGFQRLRKPSECFVQDKDEYKDEDKDKVEEKNARKLKIAVLGLGESLQLFDASQFDASIGVNDIWARVPADYVVCVDKPDRFEPERLAGVVAARCKAFYSQLGEWSFMPNFYPIELQPAYPTYICQLDPPALPKSHCSPFIAAAIACKLHNASEVHLFGVDLVNHPLLKAATCERIRIHFKNLRDAMALRGCVLKVHGGGLLRSL